MGERDLHMQGHGDDVRDEHEGDAEGPGGEGAPEKQVPEEEPVCCHGYELCFSGPGCAAKIGGAGGEKVEPGEEVEVEAGDAHDGVVGIGLVGDGEGGEAVEVVSEVVVG